MKVNGPVNIIRLEGEVDGIQKIVYLMMDYHLEPNMQTKCPDLINQEVDQYILNQISPDKTYDIFVETNELVYNPSADSTRDNIYILQIRQLAQKIKSKKLQNIRAHWIDTRDFIFVNHEANVNNLENLKSKILRDFNINYSEIYDFMIEIDKYITRYYYIFKTLFPTDKIGYTFKQEDEPPKKYVDFINNHVKKLRERYNHGNIKHQINHYIDTNINKLFKDFFHNMYNSQEQLSKYYNKYMKEYNGGDAYYKLTKNKLVLSEIAYGYGIDDAEIDKISDIMDKIINYIYDIGVTLVGLIMMDMFFLRRMLDKDYITNSIVYTGALHSAHYIFNLVKYFNFKITHASYSQKSIPEINKIVKHAHNHIDVYKNFLPPVLVQCSDSSKLPDMFM